MKRHRVRGVTLIELLVVIAIIALLIGILLPSISRARNAARQALSLNNCRQILIASAAYRFDKKDLVPMRGSRYSNGLVEGWDTWCYGGKNSDKWWQSRWGGIFDEAAYTRPLNQYIYPHVELTVPSSHLNYGSGMRWTFVSGYPTDHDRMTVQMPVFKSPGDRYSYQRNWPDGSEEPGSSYNDVGTSYHLNMKWWDQPPLNAMPFTPRYWEGTRRIRLASEFDPTSKFVWLHDQTTNIVASAPQDSGGYLGEFGEKNKSVHGYLDGRVTYNDVRPGMLYDGRQIHGNWVLTGKYTFIFVLPGGTMPAP